MNHSAIATLRLVNQQLATTKRTTVKELVDYMGAMQAQDFNQAKWAIGVRLPHLTEEQVEEAFNRGDIIRTHLMRPTWHFVSADDVYWMLKLSAKQIKSAMKSRNRELELTGKVFGKSQEIIVKQLEGNRSLSRDEINTQLNQAGITTNDNRLSHILMEAEIDGIICSGGIRGKKQTHALLSERVPVKKEISEEEAVALLAKKYFTSHGPATLADFTWWSGLPVTQARKAIEMNKNDIFSEVIENEQYWFSDRAINIQSTDSAWLLPAFDEYLIAYKNRSAIITREEHAKAISKQGMFWPVIVVNGQISGLWKRTIKNDTVLIETEQFRPHSNREKQLIEKASEAFAYFVRKKIKPK